MKIVKMVIADRKSSGNMAETISFTDFNDLNSKIQNIINSPSFPYVKIILELIPIEWKPTKDERNQLALIEQGKYISTDAH